MKIGNKLPKNERKQILRNLRKNNVLTQEQIDLYQQHAIHTDLTEKLLKTRKLTQAHIADLLGCSEKTYRGYEDETVSPSVEQLTLLADFYNVSVDYILGRSSCTSVENQYISDMLGLSDESIENIKKCRKQWLVNDASICMLDSYTGGQINRTSQVFTQQNTLNTLLSSKHLMGFVSSLNHFINAQYNIPVHYKRTSGRNAGGWIRNNTQIYNGFECITLACNEENLSDNVDVLVDDTFLESVALKQIEQILSGIKAELPQRKWG